MTVRERIGLVWIFDQIGGDSDRISSKFRMEDERSSEFRGKGVKS